MGILKNPFKKCKERLAERKHRETLERAGTIYQLCEHDGELWLTYSGNLVCPCSMLNVEPVYAVRVLREMYITGEEVPE